ncbi:GYP5 [[Candida] subhashii]|uniref:GTPase-activating protein GYP5 n=1 Tax=[Candida] subhashii TaxID=561895 RepID=A0A8J5UZB4_9ASCO|nr:GYP5 [[Candida] subhashii]KAG7664820.1 GYP5 [[Candida] subhashii]
MSESITTTNMSSDEFVDATEDHDQQEEHQQEEHNQQEEEEQEQVEQDKPTEEHNEQDQSSDQTEKIEESPKQDEEQQEQQNGEDQHQEEESNDKAPPLPNRKSIEVCIRLDEPGSPQKYTITEQSIEQLNTISKTYDKSSTNFLLQSKYNQLNHKFNQKNTEVKESINTGTENIKRTFNDIKATVGAFEEYKIDWEFWTKVVNDYNYVINHESNKLHELIMSGIPKEIRGIIWQLVSKSKNFQLEELYLDLKNEVSIHDKGIKRDLSRTSFFTNVEAVNKGTELYNVIKAYSLFDPEVGYTQGMIFIAIPLIMNMSEAECFCLLVTLMKEYKLRDLFIPEMKGLHLMLYEFDRLLESYAPVLYNHLVKQGIKSSMYASQWFLTFFAYKFPLDIVLRIYDIIVTQGMEAVLKFAVNLMLKNESNLLALSFDKLLEFLKDNLFNIYISEEFINFKDDSSNTTTPTKNSKRFSLLPSSSSSRKTNNSSNVIPTSSLNYYKLDSLVSDSMKINVDPIDLTKYENEFEGIYINEKSKLEDIKQMKIENGNLRNKIKQLEIQFNNLNHDHVDIVQTMVDIKISLPDILNDNEDLKISIEQLNQDIAELESKMVDTSSSAASAVSSSNNESSTPGGTALNLPSAIENNIIELLKINAEEAEKSANLEDELNNLLDEEIKLDEELKKYSKNSSNWFSRWGKKVQ